MPVLIPIVAAGAAYFGAGAIVGALALSGIAAVAVGVVAGAVIGAAVGAVGAAVTGGDIGKGALWGAIGGAVAGGVAGFAAAGSAGSQVAGNSTNQALNYGKGATNVLPSSTTAANVAPVAEAGMTAGQGTMYGQAVSSVGQMVTGYAQGEGAGDAAAITAEQTDKARQEQFAQTMLEIDASHKARLAEIGVQNDTSMALADKNNAANMSQLNTRIGADKEAIDAATAEKDAKIAALNESIRGTDATLFDRPTFDFNAQEGTAFDSGFAEATAQSPNISPEELQALQRATA